MPALTGTNVDPRIVDSPIDKREAIAEAKKKEIQVVEESLSRWNQFSGTRTGQVVCELCDPMIEHLKGELCSMVVSLRAKFNKRGVPNITEREIERYLDECRGALGVWESIKYRSEGLERRLNELKGQVEEDGKGKPLSEKVKKYT